MKKRVPITIQQLTKRIIYIVENQKEFPKPLEDMIIREIEYYINNHI